MTTVVLPKGVLVGKGSEECMKARRYNTPLRSQEYTDIVYGGSTGSVEDLHSVMRQHYPQKSEYRVFWGELHGHTNLSDGTPSVDEYFDIARREAKLDFCALTDHDHGGVGKPELWGDKWRLIQQKVQEYNEDNRFITILAYERDSYPWYNNLVLYYRNPMGEIARGEIAGEITEDELRGLLKRDDLLVVPHTTSFLDSGCDFQSIPLDLMSPLIEVYSRWGTSEYFGNPNPCRIQTRGGFWRDALNKGARMGCIAGSDDHHGYPGLRLPKEMSHPNLKYKDQGLAAVLATELTRDAVFGALKARRCYATSGARISIDLRINGKAMGSEMKLKTGQKRVIYFRVTGEDNLETVTLIKNGKDFIVFSINGQSINFQYVFFDHDVEQDTDYYYLRVEQVDGRNAWTSPIWIDNCL
jgi:hypothetical protein